MSLQSFQETLVSSAAAGAQLTNSTTATSIIKTSDKITLPPAYFGVVGKTLRISGMAEVSNIVTTPGTLTIDVRLGGTVVWNGAAMQMSTTAHTSFPMWFTILLTCRAIGSGSSANLMGIGTFTSQTLSVSGADATTGHAILVAPNSAPAVGTGFDSTASQTLDLFAKFSIANAGNNITLHQYVVESLN